MAIRDLREIIKDEDLNPDYFEGQANGIVIEFNKEHIDPNYVIEKVRNLTMLPYLVCRDKYGWGSPKVEKCVYDLLNLDRFTTLNKI